MPVMGTFHSLCARILRRDIEHLGRDRSFVIYDSDDQEKLMKSVLQEMRIDEGEIKARAALSYVSRFKSEALTPDDALPKPPPTAWRASSKPTTLSEETAAEQCRGLR
jgi:superfamily I DNA/RNA helicase